MSAGIRNRLLVGGEWIEGSDRFPTIDPATEETITEVEEAGPGEVDRAVRSAREAFESGTVWINTYNRYDSASPFGGVKQSGFDRDLGRHALENYTRTKSVWVSLD